MEPSISDLRYFLEVAKTLNMTRAAERLMVGQSTLSGSMRRLEEIVGVQLLIRNKTGLQLTKAGQQFLRSSQEFVERWELLKASAKSAHHEVHGLFSLGCHPNPARYILPMFFAELRRRYPKLQIQLTHDRSQVLNEMVISSKLDFAIVSLAAPHPDLVVIQLGADKFGIWAHRELRVDPDKTLLMFDPMVSYSQELLKTLEKSGQSFQQTLCSSSIEVIWSLAEASVGAAMMPNNPVLHSQGTKLHLLKSFPQVGGDLSLIYRADSQKSAAAKAIIKVIRDHCFSNRK